MPILNGYEASKTIKKLIKEENFADCYIIAYSANSQDEEEIKKCESYGMDSYLEKPSKEEDFNFMISNILNNYF